MGVLATCVMCAAVAACGVGGVCAACVSSSAWVTSTVLVTCAVGVVFVSCVLWAAWAVCAACDVGVVCLSVGVRPSLRLFCDLCLFFLVPSVGRLRGWFGSSLVFWVRGVRTFLTVSICCRKFLEVLTL